MKKLKRFALAFAALALLAAALLCPAVSAANLDEIEKYFITVRISRTAAPRSTTTSTGRCWTPPPPARWNG